MKNKKYAINVSFIIMLCSIIVLTILYFRWYSNCLAELLGEIMPRKRGDLRNYWIIVWDKADERLKAIYDMHGKKMNYLEETFNYKINECDESI